MKPFQLIIWAIVALLIIFIAIDLFLTLFPQENITGILQKNIKLAETNEFLGKTIDVGTHYIEEDTIFLKNSFDITNRSVAIECTDPNLCCNIDEKCEKEIEWNYTNAKIKKFRSINFFVRCINVDELSVCRIYIGKEPAQAKIIETKELNKAGNSIVLETRVKNIGKNDLVFGKSSVELLKNVNEHWLETGEEFPIQNIDLLQTGMEHSFTWNIEVKTLGEYKLVFTFEGQNAGFDKNEFIFENASNEFCIIDNSETETLSAGNERFYESHYCTGCNFAYECLAKWQETMPDANWELVDEETAYCLKDTFDGNC